MNFGDKFAFGIVLALMAVGIVGVVVNIVLAVRGLVG